MLAVKGYRLLENYLRTSAVDIAVEKSCGWLQLNFLGGQTVDFLTPRHGEKKNEQKNAKLCFFFFEKKFRKKAIFLAG